MRGCILTIPRNLSNWADPYHYLTRDMGCSAKYGGRFWLECCGGEGRSKKVKRGTGLLPSPLSLLRHLHRLEFASLKSGLRVSRSRLTLQAVDKRLSSLSYEILCQGLKAILTHHVTLNTEDHGEVLLDFLCIRVHTNLRIATKIKRSVGVALAASLQGPRRTRRVGVVVKLERPLGRTSLYGD